jgi:hypothetical protein
MHMCEEAEKRARLTWRQQCVALVAKDDLPVSTSSPRIIIVYHSETMTLLIWSHRQSPWLA